MNVSTGVGEGQTRPAGGAAAGLATGATGEGTPARAATAAATTIGGSDAAREKEGTTR